MAVSNICRLANDLFDTNEFSMGAYFFEDFFSIGYLACVHHMNYSRSTQKEADQMTQYEESDQSSVKLSNLYLRQSRERAFKIITNTESNSVSGFAEDLSFNLKTEKLKQSIISDIPNSLDDYQPLRYSKKRLVSEEDSNITQSLDDWDRKSHTSNLIATRVTLHDSPIFKNRRSIRRNTSSALF